MSLHSKPSNGRDARHVMPDIGKVRQFGATLLARVRLAIIDALLPSRRGFDGRSLCPQDTLLIGVRKREAVPHPAAFSTAVPGKMNAILLPETSNALLTSRPATTPFV